MNGMTPDLQEPEVVYHYTTIDTMMKIVDKCTIRATSISYLNDVSEREHYLRLIRDHIPTHLQTYPLEDEGIFDDLLNGSDLGFDDRPFVASFSREDDSLPQWRSYCPQGNGVAIGFRVDCLKHAYLEEPRREGLPPVLTTFKPRVSFRKVDYVDASQIQSLDKDISAAISGALENAKEDNDRPSGLFPNFITSPSIYFKAIIEGVASSKKHPSFVNEHEYRVLVDSMFWQKHRIEFRTTRSTLVPFVSVKIPERDSQHRDKPLIRPITGDRWGFIDRVVIGPTPNERLSVDSVEAFFQKYEMTVEVVASKIPFRDW